MEIDLGDKVKDKYTELEGTAVAKATYINGCVQYLILPEALKDGKPIDDIWIDEVQLVVVLRKLEREINEDRHGGIRSHPS